MPYRSNDPFLSLLRSLSGTHVHFFPKSGNSGDGFIAHATYELFKAHGIKFTTHRQTDTVEGETILIGGGGNLVEGRYGDVANLIRRHSKNNKIILLPHTIVGFADVLSETHRNLTVFCREPVSYQMALLNGASPANTHLSHDVAFFLNDEYFSKFFDSGAGVLQAWRTDGEMAGQLEIPEGNIDISLSWNGDLWTSPDFCLNVTNSMAAFIAPFETVQTDRLHVAILSAYLRKNVFLSPNAYYKNRAIFEHSLEPRFSKVNFLNISKNTDEVFEPVLAPSHNSERLRGDNAGAVSAAEWERMVEVQKQHASELEAALERETSMRENAQRALQLKKQQWEDSMSDLRSRFESVSSSHAVALDRLKAREKELTLQLAACNEQLIEILRSTSWRLASPLRIVARAFPVGLRSKIRSIIRPLS
jgi:exopolysaccharide biosynthesis predicted pyruvyltransferase EpsI